MNLSIALLREAATSTVSDDENRATQATTALSILHLATVARGQQSTLADQPGKPAHVTAHWFHESGRPDSLFGKVDAKLIGVIFVRTLPSGKSSIQERFP